MTKETTESIKPKFFELVEQVGNKNPFLLVVFSFIGSFLIARGFTYILPSFQIHIIGIHIHHYYR